MSLWVPHVPLAWPEAQPASVPGQCLSETPELLAGTPFFPASCFAPLKTDGQAGWGGRGRWSSWEEPTAGKSGTGVLVLVFRELAIYLGQAPASLATAPEDENASVSKVISSLDPAN